MRAVHRITIGLIACLALAACSRSNSDGVADIAYIGQPGAMFAKGVRLSGAAQQLRAATAEGLVALNEKGEVVPAIAERWIVTEDGLSYIFRLRDSDLPNGSDMTAVAVHNAFNRSRNQLAGTSLALDLAKISEVRAMTGKVVEIQLKSPMPDLLQLLAQPELGLRFNGKGTGPMALERKGDIALLTALPPEKRGMPEQPDWADHTRQVELRALDAAAAVEAFNSGKVDTVLGGTLANMPLADVGPLSRGTVRLDAALGLFGLRVNSQAGFFGDPKNREAVAMAIDRGKLLEPFNIGGWQPTTRIVPTGLPVPDDGAGERWEGMSQDERAKVAADRVAAWKSAHGGDLVVRIGLPKGRGSDLLFGQLAKDLGAVGITAKQVGMGAGAELELVDRLPRYAGPRWFLNQFNCRLRVPICSAKADKDLALLVAENDAGERDRLRTEAIAELTALNGYIPLGAPIRWSLVRGDVQGFADNRWGLHPLYPFAIAPIS